MRIAVIHSFYDRGQPSGENAVVVDQVEQLTTSGHEVRLFARYTDEQSVVPMYEARAALTVASGRGPAPGVALEAFAPDVVHVHNTFPNWSTAWTRRWRDRLVVTLHNFRPMCAAATLTRDGRYCDDCLKTPIVPAIRFACYRGSHLKTLPLAVAASPLGPLRQMAARSSAVIALNVESQMLFQKTLSRSVDLVPNFVRPHAPVQASPTGRWLYVGRFAAEKGIARLIQNWPSGEQLDVFGSGPDEAAIRQLAETREVDIRGLLARDQLLDLMARYQGLILPSLWAEGIPTILLEALAQGLPIIVSDRISAGASIEAAGAGVRYNPTVPETLSSALRECRQRRVQMAESARALHVAEYSPDTWQTRVEAIYARLPREWDSARMP